MQSILHPAGLQAAHVAHLWWIMCAICGAVWCAVAVAALLAIARGRRSGSTATDPQLTRAVACAVGLSTILLLALLTQSVVTGRALDALQSPGALRIQVTGNQWWWEVQYPNASPSLRVTTANEIHIPVGRPIHFDLLANDVIHSLWIPNLQGKIDLVPGRLNELWLQADTAGIYRGQCAEFCGLQHAKMALLVVAEGSDDFERWLAGNRLTPPAPVAPGAQRGRDLVEHGSCAMCHTVAGTLAGGRMGPDLTHVASRLTLAAGTLPNTRGHLAGWIADPQGIKPGSRMPPQALSGDDLQAVLAYLDTLR